MYLSRNRIAPCSVLPKVLSTSHDAGSTPSGTTAVQEYVGRLRERDVRQTARQRAAAESAGEMIWSVSEAVCDPQFGNSWRRDRRRYQEVRSGQRRYAERLVD